MLHKPYRIMFGGQAGYGVMSAGNTIARAAGQNGLWALVVNEYPSLIRGGLNTCLVEIDSRRVQAAEEKIDFLGALSQQALDQNINKLVSGAAVLYDSDTVSADLAKMPQGVKLYPVKFVQWLTGDSAKVMINSLVLGAFSALTGFSFDAIVKVLQTEFKNPKIFQQNRLLFQLAFDHTRQTYAIDPVFPHNFSSDGSLKMLVNGNEAISMGAIKAGVKFSAGYPMTPGSSVLTYLADHAADYGLVFKQAEDEISAINMLIGSGFAGVRSIGATSGGGFALMVEALGFAAQAEVPLVIVNAQRGGPSTGLPTRTAQADLDFVVHASQGEFPRIIVAPGDIDECFTETFRLFNLVEKYQMPGIILTDKYLADSEFIHPFFDDSKLRIDRGKLVDENWLTENQPYRRYQLTSDGISSRAIPGQSGGRHIATSYTHGEDGFYSSGNHEYAADEPEITVSGIDKLFNKVPALLNEIPGVKLHGAYDAELTVIAWGSTKGAVLEAIEMLAREGRTVNFLQILYPSPFPAEAVERVLAASRKTLLVEGNKTGQMARMIRSHTGYAVNSTYLKYDSRPFTPSGIADKIREVLA